MTTQAWIAGSWAAVSLPEGALPCVLGPQRLGAVRNSRQGAGGGVQGAQVPPESPGRQLHRQVLLSKIPLWVCLPSPCSRPRHPENLTLASTSADRSPGNEKGFKKTPSESWRSAPETRAEGCLLPDRQVAWWGPQGFRCCQRCRPLSPWAWCSWPCSPACACCGGDPPPPCSSGPSPTAPCAGSHTHFVVFYRPSLPVVTAMFALILPIASPDCFEMFQGW